MDLKIFKNVLIFFRLKCGLGDACPFTTRGVEKCLVMSRILNCDHLVKGQNFVGRMKWANHLCIALILQLTVIRSSQQLDLGKD